jgi:hypothetical protein
VSEKFNEASWNLRENPLSALLVFYMRTDRQTHMARLIETSLEIFISNSPQKWMAKMRIAVMNTLRSWALLIRNSICPSRRNFLKYTLMHATGVYRRRQILSFWDFTQNSPWRRDRYLVPKRRQQQSALFQIQKSKNVNYTTAEALNDVTLNWFSIGCFRLGEKSSY